MGKIPLATESIGPPATAEIFREIIRRRERIYIESEWNKIFETLPIKPKERPVFEENLIGVVTFLGTASFHAISRLSASQEERYWQRYRSALERLITISNETVDQRELNFKLMGAERNLLENGWDPLPDYPTSPHKGPIKEALLTNLVRAPAITLLYDAVCQLQEEAALNKSESGGNRKDIVRHEFMRYLRFLVISELKAATNRVTEIPEGPLADFLAACCMPLGLSNSLAALIQTYRRANTDQEWEAFQWRAEHFLNDRMLPNFFHSVP